MACPSNACVAVQSFETYTNKSIRSGLGNAWGFPQIQNRKKIIAYQAIAVYHKKRQIYGMAISSVSPH